MKYLSYGVIALASVMLLTGPARAQEEMDLSLMPTSIPADVMTEMQELYGQLQAVTERLTAIQEQAFEREDVLAALTDFETQLKEKIIGIDPSAEQTVEQLEKLVEELSAVEAVDGEFSDEEMQALQEKYEQYQELAYSLHQVEQEARMDEALAAKQDQVQQMVLDAMSAIDPDTETLIAQHEGLIDRLMEIEEAQMRAMGGDPFGGFELNVGEDMVPEADLEETSEPVADDASDAPVAE